MSISQRKNPADKKSTGFKWTQKEGEFIYYENLEIDKIDDQEGGPKLHLSVKEAGDFSSLITQLLQESLQENKETQDIVQFKHVKFINQEKVLRIMQVAEEGFKKLQEIINQPILESKSIQALINELKIKKEECSPIPFKSDWIKKIILLAEKIQEDPLYNPKEEMDAFSKTLEKNKLLAMRLKDGAQFTIYLKEGFDKKNVGKFIASMTNKLTTQGLQGIEFDEKGMFRAEAPLTPFFSMRDDNRGAGKGNAGYIDALDEKAMELKKQLVKSKDFQALQTIIAKENKALSSIKHKKQDQSPLINALYNAMIESNAHELLSLAANYSDNLVHQLIKKSLNALDEEDKKQNIKEIGLKILDLFDNPTTFFNQLPRSNSFKQTALTLAENDKRRAAKCCIVMLFDQYRPSLHSEIFEKDKQVLEIRQFIQKNRKKTTVDEHVPPEKKIGDVEKKSLENFLPMDSINKMSSGPLKDHFNLFLRTKMENDEDFLKNQNEYVRLIRLMEILAHINTVEEKTENSFLSLFHKSNDFSNKIQTIFDLKKDCSTVTNAAIDLLEHYKTTQNYKKLLDYYNQSQKYKDYPRQIEKIIAKKYENLAAATVQRKRL